MSDGKGKIKNKLLDRFFEPIDSQGETDMKKENEPTYQEDVIESQDIHVEAAVVNNELSVVKEPTVISGETTIHGNIIAENDIEIKGEIVGDITSQGFVKVMGGKITGNIKAKEIFIKGSYVQGYLDSDSVIDIVQESEITGNITGGDILIDSKCQGNITAKERLKLLENAMIRGDITTKIIKIEEGAILEGNFKMM